MILSPGLRSPAGLSGTPWAREHGGGALVLLEPDELGDELGGDVEGGNDLGLLGVAGKLPGLFHEFLEAGYIEVDFPFAAEELREVDRKTEGVVELERDGARKDAMGEFGDLFLEERQTPVEGFVEAALLTFQGVHND